LLELEVPEIFNNTVEIKAIAREAGSRSKVAVHATQEGVDPVGSCVGVRGGRIQTVVNELNGEKIDVVQWDADVGAFIANALSPAKVMNVLLSDDPQTGKTATVIVPDRQLSLAIGKEGQNARLAAKLTGWRIDIKSATETAEETLGRLDETAIPLEDMDLLTLAETLLRKRELDEFSETERVLIDAEVDRESAIDRDWPSPEEQSVPEGAEAQAEAVSEAPEVSIDLEEAPAAEEELVTVAEDLEDLGPSAAKAEAIDDEAVPEVPVALVEEAVDEAELEPSFEGEPVEDSLGWVVTEPPKEYQYDWGESAWEDEQPSWETEPEIEEVEKREELPKPRRRKGRKKKGRQVFDYEDEDAQDLNRWR
jgi:transcription antitermination factor NusA-like protein